MPEPACHRTEIYPRRKELGRVVVPQLLEARDHAESLGHAIEPLSHGVRHEWTLAVRVEREQERQAIEGKSELGGLPILAH